MSARDVAGHMHWLCGHGVNAECCCGMQAGLSSLGFGLCTNCWARHAASLSSLPMLHKEYLCTQGDVCVALYLVLRPSSVSDPVKPNEAQ